ncbi:MAG: Nif3-like dinuclear metal center hexameric protein [Cytophagaceae bacterium]|jgi:dinuclear metal center YbgI/SA1388 family protein|nr:Nif3-like dinuclear metal center hexameric protein [Cytophagaceae bacterium]
MSNIKAHNIVNILETFAPPAFQEDYDNSGLQTGSLDSEVTGLLITLDVTPEVIEEAIACKINFILSHHPVTLAGIKKMTGSSLPVRIFTEAIRNNLIIYSAHTNLDSVKDGVSGILARKTGLINCRVLSPRKQLLTKLVTFVPVDYAGKVRNALFEAGAGHIGKYDCCSYNIEGEGTFRGGEAAHPFVGEKGNVHTESEIRIETVIPVFLQNKVLKALLATHPYEEPAYDFYLLENKWNEAGFGIIGELPEPQSPECFLAHLKNVTQTGCIRHTDTIRKTVKTIAVCGGSGSFLLHEAINIGADVFVSGDFKYHQFFDAPNTLMIADIGHYESEQFTKELLLDILTKRFPDLTLRISGINSNPIKYC